MTSEFQNINKIIDRLQKRSGFSALARSLSDYSQEFVRELEIDESVDCSKANVVYACTAAFGGNCVPKKDGNFHCSSDRAYLLLLWTL